MFLRIIQAPSHSAPHMGTRQFSAENWLCSLQLASFPYGVQNGWGVVISK